MAKSKCVKCKQKEELIKSIVVAWEALPEGNHTPRAVESWLRNKMFPKIQKARVYLGVPKGMTYCGREIEVKDGE